LSNHLAESAGEPKLKIKEMGSRYLFISLYVWLEKYFSRGDYKRSAESGPSAVLATTNASALKERAAHL